MHILTKLFAWLDPDHPNQCRGHHCYDTDYQTVLLRHGINANKWCRKDIRVAWAKLVLESSDYCHAARHQACIILAHEKQKFPPSLLK